MSDKIKNSTFLRGILDDRNQALRIATAEELLGKADLHRAEARYQGLVADRLKAQALATMMEAEIYDAEKREFCEEAEAEISAREAAEAAALSPAPSKEAGKGEQFAVDLSARLDQAIEAEPPEHRAELRGAISELLGRKREDDDGGDGEDAPLDAFQEPETRAGRLQEGVEEINGGSIFTTEQAPEGALNFLITEHQDKHAPLFPPEPPPAATPEQLEATGVIDGEAGWWGRKLMKERA